MEGLLTQQTPSEHEIETKSDNSYTESLATNKTETALSTLQANPNIETKIEQLRNEDAKKLSKLRGTLGLIPKKISEWLNSKEGHPNTNIFYREDRMYRCIGPTGYEDFINTGIIRSRNRAKYQDVSFNIGEPASLYMEGDSGDFILEATSDSAEFDFKINPYSLSGKPMKDIPYRSCADGALTKESRIRIFKRTDKDIKSNTYMVVFDNISDTALKDK